MLGIGADIAPASARAVRSAIPAPSLDMNFLYGVMPPGVTFTRASTAAYTDVNGAAQVAAVDQPRLTASGLMIFDAAAAGAIENATMSSIGGFYNAAEGTLFVEFTRAGEPTTTHYVASLRNSASIADRHSIAFSTTGSGAVRGLTVATSVAQSDVSSGVSYARSGVNRAAYAWKANDFNCAANGTVGTADTAGTIAANINLLRLGALGTTDPFNGYIRRVRCWAVRLPDATLLELTL